MLARTIAAAAMTTFLASSAFAQGALVEVSDDTVVAPFEMEADRLEDVDVYAPDGNELGDVEEVVGSARETATHLVVDFDDDNGFLDTDDVLVPLEAFTMEDNRLILSLGADEVRALPIWDD